MLEKVKTMLGITGTYQDATIQGYIDEVKQFLLDGGVDASIVNADSSAGVIARGVADLWNYGSGQGRFSKYFLQRVTQLALKKASNEPYSTLNFVKNYLYEIVYDNIDYEYAYAYMKEKQPIIESGCSSVRNGNWYGRNFDWKYDENAEFIVRTPRANGRYGSIGFASNTTDYKLVPFMMLDGINECGVVANTNVVPADKGITSGTTAKISKEIEICSLMLVRYILDHFVTAKEAAEYIENHMSVYVPTTLLDLGYETHLMIADEADTYLVEFYGDETVVTRMDKPYMTNFYLSDVTLNADGTVYTPADEGHSASENNISANGSGLERYNLIVENYSSSDTQAGMRELMNKLKFTKAYEGAEWFTEFVGINGLTVDSEPDDFADVVALAEKLYQYRIRNGKTWFTVHSAVYDIENRKVSVIVQEDGEVLNYEL
ncbi:carcinine hydrolase/isopenicillin-N N-acyltransferase family protein [Priestia megaterium]|uniref:carcinine hydrolase/isopenicillin-N N-acyltransferase family protein n=1 Tax=Priestia megaterium TaxID=1404 RepID=UPI002E246004|nr:carcinine hydrolase/isopenicillin-N N-acyltransferase family protein [Priestia megaterium]